MEYVDDFGGGGHSRDFGRLGPDKIICFWSRSRCASKYNRWWSILINENFRFSVFCVFMELKVDGILGDLGFSSHQFDVLKEVFYLFWCGFRHAYESEKWVKCLKVVNEYDDVKEFFMTMVS
jgi:16S rRNA (cytosine1402-N4)-methyltransferase